MSQRIRVDGIYDQRTLDSLKKFGVRDFCFDFRPKSFNFLQAYKCLELVSRNFSPELQFVFKYSNEKDFMIKKMIDDLRSELNKTAVSLEKHFSLEFLDKESGDFYDQFGLPFYCHYHPDVPLKQIMSAQNLKGIIFDYSFLEKIHAAGNFYNFVTNFAQQFFVGMNADVKLELGVALDWDSDIFPSLFDLLDIELVTFDINRKTEVCYRNVDLPKVSAVLDHFKNLSL